MNRTLHVSDSFSVHHQESSTVHTAIGVCHTGYADCLLAESEWTWLLYKYITMHGPLNVKIATTVYHLCVNWSVDPINMYRA